MQKKILAEFLGTFAMIFCGCGAIIIDQQTQLITHLGVSLVFGFVVSAMIFTFGEISGAHFNPVVTIAFWLSKRLNRPEVIPFISAQFSGAIVASLILKCLFPANETLGETIPAGDILQSFILEIIITFLLVLVILNVSIGSKEKGITAAIAIGSTVGLCALFAGPVSGASMNPFRSLAPAICSLQFKNIWIYLTAPLIGSVIAVFIHLQLYKHD